MPMRKNTLSGLFGAAVVAAGMLLSVGAQASPMVGDDYTFDFSFTPISNTTMDGSGSFVAEYNGGGSYAIQSITGTVDNAPLNPSTQSITGLSPYAAADNTLSYPTQPYVDFGGLSFSTLYDDYNIYWNGYYGILQASNNPVGYPNAATITFDVSPTPLPPAAMLLAGGVGLLGFFGARKRRKDGRLGATVAP
jgi:hypothetical protein